MQDGKARDVARYYCNDFRNPRSYARYNKEEKTSERGLLYTRSARLV
jgi:hypothetical protein